MIAQEFQRISHEGDVRGFFNELGDILRLHQCHIGVAKTDAELSAESDRPCSVIGEHRGIDGTVRHGWRDLSGTLRPAVRRKRNEGNLANFLD